MDASVETAPAPTTAVAPQRRHAWLALLAVGLSAIALVGAGWWLAYGRYYQSTDDAYVAGDLVNVNSQVSGTVVSIGADETARPFLTGVISDALKADLATCHSAGHC